MIDILIHSPFPRFESQGNSTSANRLEKILIDAGYCVEFESVKYGGGEARCLIALNARRSAGVIEAFSHVCPDSKIVILLTGTDINHPEMKDCQSKTWKAMERADRLVVLHEGSLLDVPEQWHEKCEVIYPSVILPEGVERCHQSSDGFCFIMSGNIREEKNIPIVIEACSQLPESYPVSVVLYGGGDGELADEIRQASDQLSNFQWLGKLGHVEMMEKLSQADGLLNSSTQEGGSNAICEAITLGVPVVASDIRGNVGMLGVDYQGFFSSGDAKELCQLFKRCIDDPHWVNTLKKQIKIRQKKFSYAEESRCWLSLIAGL